MLKFKDLNPVQYTGGESEQQDLNAMKRKRRPMDEENNARERKRNRLKKKPMVKVSVKKPVGYRIPSIGLGGVEHNVKTGTI
jgi:hypothetical protein